MFNKINQLGVETTVNNMLYGCNTVGNDINFKVFDAVHSFIESTGRL